VVGRCACTRNFVNEEALTHWWAVAPKKINKCTSYVVAIMKLKVHASKSIINQRFSAVREGIILAFYILMIT